MSLLTRARDWLFRASLEDSDRLGVWSMVRGTEPSEFQRSGTEVRRQGWERNAVVNACARAVVDIVASVDYQVCRSQADGSLEEIQHHEAADLLNMEPRVGISGYHHRAATGLNYCLYGNGFWVLERSGRKRITGVRLLHPERLKYVTLNSDDQITRFDWRDNQGMTHESPAEDVIHFRDLTAAPDGLFGYPRAAAALGDIAADDEATQYVRQIVGNHGVPGLIVGSKGATDPDDLRQAEDRFNDRMVGKGGRGRTVFVNGEELVFEQIGFNLNQLEFPDLRAITREDICTSFNVDPRMVGIGSAGGSDGGLSGVQFREARFRLIQQAVIPVMKSIESELNRWFMPEWGDRLYIRFNPDTLSELTEDETTTSTRVIAEVAAKLRTVEEGRELLGLETDYDPTHHLAGEGSLTAVKVVLAQADMDPVEKAQAMVEAMPPAPNQVGAGNSTPPSRPQLMRGLDAGMLQLLPGPIEHRAVLATDAERAAYWGAFDARATEEEPTLLQRLHDLFGNEWVRIAALVAAAGAGHTMAHLMEQVARLYAPDGPLAAAWAESLRAPIRDILASGARHTARQAPLGAAPVPAPQLLAAARRQAQDLAANVTRTTFDQIRGLLATAEAQGFDAQRIAQLLREAVFGLGMDQRVRTITRTVIPAALNAGSYYAAVESHAFQSKLWVTQRDERVRDSHVHAEGEGWIPIEKAHGNGLQHPGDPNGDASEVINCRCTQAFSHLAADRMNAA